MNFKYLLILLLLSKTIQVFSQEGFVDNVDFRAKGDVLVITYDLLNAPKNAKYEVWVEVGASDGRIIKPKNATGDIGKGVAPGSRKQINWNVVEEGIAFDEKIFVEVYAKETQGRNRNTDFTSKTYIRFGGALNAGVARKYFNEFDVFNMNYSSYSDAGKRISLGQGSNIDATIGYGRKFGIEGTLFLQQGSTYKITREDVEFNELSVYANTIKGNVVGIIPTIYFPLYNRKTRHLFKFGAILAYPTVKYGYVYEKQLVDVAVESGSIDYLLSGGIITGRLMEYSVTFRSDKNFQIVLGAQWKKMNLIPDRGKVTDYHWSKTEAPSDIEFVDTTVFGFVETNTTEQRYEKKHPFSSFGLNLGFQFRLN